MDEEKDETTMPGTGETSTERETRDQGEGFYSEVPKDEGDRPKDAGESEDDLLGGETEEVEVEEMEED